MGVRLNCLAGQGGLRVFFIHTLSSLFVALYANASPRDDDPTPRSYVVIKVCNCNIPESEVWLEANMNMHLATASPDHQGCGALRTAFEAFEVVSPRGNTHLALVFEPLREPLWLFKGRLNNEQSVSRTNRLPLIKTYIQILLQGLDYMHSKCRVVHTGNAFFGSIAWDLANLARP